MDESRVVGGLLALAGAAVAYPFYWVRTRAMANEVERYRHAFNLAPCPMWLKSPDGLVLALNKQFTDHFGLQLSDFEGRTIDEQRALWVECDMVAFDEAASLARRQDEIVLTHAKLRAPRPERSQLREPMKHYEYFISKRRFPIRHAWGTSYGTIGSAVSIESVLQYAEKARARHEEIVDRNPILHAIADLSKQLQAEVGGLDEKIDALTSDVRRIDSDLELLFEGREDLRRTRAAQRDLRQFEGFES